MLELFIALLGAAALTVLAFFYGAFAWGFVAYKFWYWFLLPVFPLVPEVTLIQCVGLMTFMALFHTNAPQIVKKEFRDETTQNLLPILAPPLVLLVGWCVHVFIVK